MAHGSDPTDPYTSNLCDKSVCPSVQRRKHTFNVIIFLKTYIKYDNY